jgi:hypothetical protein
MAERAAIIDRWLAALGTEASGQGGAAVFAVRQGRSAALFPPEKALSTRLFDRGNCVITQDILCRFVGLGARA